MMSLASVSRLARVLPQAHSVSRHTLLVRSFASFPSDRKYTQSHEWAKLNGEVATIGISNRAQEELGDIVHVDLPEVGADAKVGQATAAIESVKAAADIYSPVAGEVVEVNDVLGEQPGLVNTEPHDEGWLFKIKVADVAPLDSLLSSEDYEATLEK